LAKKTSNSNHPFLLHSDGSLVDTERFLALLQAAKQQLGRQIAAADDRRSGRALGGPQVPILPKFTNICNLHIFVNCKLYILHFCYF
jgi:hypothetical protein